MNGALQIGPLSVPFALLLVLGAIALGSLVSDRIARKLGILADAEFTRLIFIALLGARLAFVIQFRDAYRLAPLSILDIRDGGWNAWAGIAAAWAYALILVWRRRPTFKPLAGALAAATTLWALGTATLALWPASTTRLPAIQLASLDGRAVSLSQFEGKPTVVNLWATWCPPCQREMPALETAQREHPDVHFVFLNQGESAVKVGRFLSAQKLGLRNVLLDERGEASGQFGQRALPTTLFFDAQGRLADTRIGELSGATLAQRLQAIVSLPLSQPQ